MKLSLHLFHPGVCEKSIGALGDGSANTLRLSCHRSAASSLIPPRCALPADVNTGLKGTPPRHHRHHHHSSSLWPEHVSNITLHNNVSPTLIIPSRSARRRGGRARPSTLCAQERARSRPREEAAPCAGAAIGLLWEFPTSYLPPPQTCLLFLCISFSIDPNHSYPPTPQTHKHTRNLLPAHARPRVNAKPQQKRSDTRTRRRRRRCGCLMTDSASSSSSPSPPAHSRHSRRRRAEAELTFGAELPLVAAPPVRHLLLLARCCCWWCWWGGVVMVVGG